MKAFIISALWKFAFDLFGNKTRTGLTSAGAVLVSLLVASGINPDAARALSNVGMCAAVEAVKFHEQQQQQGAQEDAGDTVGFSGERQPGGGDSGIYLYRSEPRSVGAPWAPSGPYERAATATGKPVDAPKVMAWRWPWVGPPPVPAFS